LKPKEGVAEEGVWGIGRNEDEKVKHSSVKHDKRNQARGSAANLAPKRKDFEMGDYVITHVLIVQQVHIPDGLLTAAAAIQDLIMAYIQVSMDQRE